MPNNLPNISAAPVLGGHRPASGWNRCQASARA